MTIGAKVAKNTIIQLVGKVISTILGLAAVSIMTRYLGQNGFGQYTTILTFLSFFGIIADFGLTLVTTQMLGQPEVDEEKVVNNLFTMRFFSALFFLGLGPAAVLLFPYESAVKAGVAIATISFFCTALNQIMTGLFQRRLQMDRVAVSEVAGRIVFLLGMVLAAHYQWPLTYIMIVTAVSGLANYALNHYFASQLIRLRFVYDKEVWREVAGKSWPLAITIFFNLIYMKTDTLLLSLIKTQSEVGIYGAAYKVIEILVTLPFMFAGLVLPVMAARWAEKSIDGFRTIFQKSFDVMAIVAVPMTAGTWFVSGQTMAMIAGDEFFASGKALDVLMIAASIIFIGTIFSHSVIAVNEQKKLIPGYVFTGITAVIGYLLFIPRYSYMGAAWVTVYSELFIALFNCYIFWRKAGVWPNGKIFKKSVYASAVMIGALYVSSKMSAGLFPLLSVGISVYAAALYFLDGLTFISFKEIFSLSRRSNQA